MQQPSVDACQCQRSSLSLRNFRQRSIISQFVAIHDADRWLACADRVSKTGTQMNKRIDENRSEDDEHNTFAVVSPVVTNSRQDVGGRLLLLRSHIPTLSTSAASFEPNCETPHCRRMVGWL